MHIAELKLSGNRSIARGSGHAVNLGLTEEDREDALRRGGMTGSEMETASIPITEGNGGVTRSEAE